MTRAPAGAKRTSIVDQFRFVLNKFAAMILLTLVLSPLGAELM